MGPKKKRRCEKPSPVPEGKEAIPVLKHGLPTKAAFPKASVTSALQVHQIRVNHRYEAQRDASGKYYTCVVKKINEKEQQCYVQWEDGTESSYVKIDAMRFQLVTLSDSE
jgi:protein-tyrosine phosphatase